MPKSSGELSQERLDVEASIPTVLTRLEPVSRTQLARFDSVFSIMAPAIRVQMADSLKQRHLQRALPLVVGSLSVESLKTLVTVLSTASEPYVDDFGVVCRQILSTFYTTGIIASKKTADSGTYIGSPPGTADT